MDLTGVRSPTTFDNVWDIDCSVFFSPTVEGRQIHSASFDTGDTLMRELLRGIDRTVLATLGLTQGPLAVISLYRMNSTEALLLSVNLAVCRG